MTGKWSTDDIAAGVVSRVVALQRELDEANAELQRHHRDFERIREVLHEHEQTLDPYDGEMKSFILLLRGIVG